MYVMCGRSSAEDGHEATLFHHMEQALGLLPLEAVAAES